MWNYRSFSFLILIFFYTKFTCGQGNLIPNPSFEKDPLRYDVHIDEDPSYFISKDERPFSGVVTNNTLKVSCSDCYTVQDCHSGKNCIVLYNSASMGERSPYRSLIQGKLREPLKKDSTYYFAAYLCNSYSNPYNPEVPFILSKERVYNDKLPLRLRNYQKLRLPVVRDSSWQKVSISFKANDNYQYFILGEADEKSPVIRVPGEKHKTIQTVIDDLWLSQDPNQVINDYSNEKTNDSWALKFFFETGKANINNPEDVFSGRDRQALQIDSIIIHSYTDGLGSEEANKALSIRRSEAVIEYLKKDGISVPADHVRVYNHGESACGEMENPDCRYSLLKMYYHHQDRHPADIDTNFLKTIVLPHGDTVYVINQELDFKVARKKRQYRKALHLIKQDKYKEKWRIGGEEAELWALAGECDSSMAILSELYHTNPDHKWQFDFTMPYLLNCIDHPVFRSLRNNYISTHLNDSVQYPWFIDQLWVAQIKDQGYSGLIQSHEKFPQKDSPTLIDSLWRLKRIFQQENEMLLNSIIDSIGWPTEEKVGKIDSTAAFMIIQHSTDLSFQKTLLGTIKHYAQSGEISPRSYAYLADRVSLRTSGKQLFGTQVLKQSDGTYTIAPYEDLKTLLRGREIYNLSDWNEYLSRFGLEVEY